jgi:5-methylthioribose kinase
LNPLELSLDNAAAYLAARGFRAEALAELGGGVSNTVLLARTDRGRIVLKQALGRLRVEQEWLSDRTRIFRESAAMKALGAVLPPKSVPSLVFEDRENLIFAMAAAEETAAPWKDLLMRGEIHAETAAGVGSMLGEVIRSTWANAAYEREFGDQAVFDQLRIDPYYRTTARRHPDLAGRFQALMEQSAARRVSMVHGDWSPKNFLVDGVVVTAIDWEVVHYGDPAFDSAFLLNHLRLKAFRNPQWKSRYREAAGAFWKQLWVRLPEDAEWFETATLAHLGCLMLARVDGKSPAEYLTEGLKVEVREFARRLIASPPWSVSDLWS